MSEAPTSHTPSPHTPVLYREVIENAAASAGELWVDCTLGRGGHAEGLLEAGVRLIGFDRDPDALSYCARRLERFGDRFTPVHADFRELSARLSALGVSAVDGVLADLGVSSPQLDEAARGFSFSASGPVDMRMDPTAGPSAADLIATLDEPALARALHEYGEEPLARPIARALKAWWAAGGGDTLSLAAAVEAATPARVRYQLKKHPATRTFQALRILVNDELGALEELISAAPPLLAPGGRLLVISFHSLEDRALKVAFRALSEPPQPPRRGLPPPPGAAPSFEARPRKSIPPADDELEVNPRARSAKLRVLRRLPSSLSPSAL
jgi:16S rRNA (cytosine1402-N4)-methyltransferase